MGDSHGGSVPGGPVGLQLLGCFRLRRGDRAVELPEGTQRLLALLGVRGSDRRLAIASQLWPEAPERAALARLRTALWRVPKGSGIVLLNGQRLSLAPFVAVDTWQLVRRAESILAASPNPAEESSTDILRDPFPAELLPGWYDDWVLMERERLRQLQLHALEALSASLLRRARFGEALEAGMRAVYGDPLRESARRRVIAVHLAEDNLVEALQHYREFAAVLREEIGVEPSVELRAQLDRAILDRGGRPPRPSQPRPRQPSTPDRRRPGASASAVRRPVQ